MDFSAVANVSLAGMEVERARLDVSAINMANVHTTRTAFGGSFQPLRVVNTATKLFSNSLLQSGQPSVAYIPSARIEQVYAPPRFVHEPGHPDANEKGFVAYPGVDSVTEMVNVMSAVRSYEANLVAINAAKSMAMKALEIGSGG